MTVKTDRGIVFSLPTASSLYFCHMPTPLFYDTFLPCSLAYAGGEDNIIEMLKRHRVDYVVITGRVTPEYGYSAFGIDYAKRIDAWIRVNYRLEKVYGKYPFTSPAFGIAVYRLKS